MWGDLDRESPGSEWIAIAQSGRMVAGYFPEAGRGAALLPGWPVDLGAEVFTYPSLADLDGDGFLDVLIPTEDARVHVLSWNGVRRIGWPVALPPRIDGAAIAGETPLVADFDGGPAKEVAVGIRDGRVMAYDAAGRPLAGWPYGAGEPFQYTPALVALAASPSESPQLALLTAPFDGFLYGQRLGEWESPIAWAGIGGDGTHNAKPVAADTAIAREGSLLATSKTFAYPNPVRGSGRTTVRYSLGQAARVGMKFFDLSGELVSEVPPSNRPAGDNEYLWDVRGLATGVYLCELTVDGQRDTASTLLKIAVMR
jgi:hypothetical protein